MKEIVITVMVVCYTFVGCFGSIPQIIKTFKTKSVADISVTSWLLWTASSLSYLVYALVVNPKLELIFTAAIDAFFNIFIMLQVVWYGYIRNKIHDNDELIKKNGGV